MYTLHDYNVIHNLLPSSFYYLLSQTLKGKWFLCMFCTLFLSTICLYNMRTGSALVIATHTCILSNMYSLYMRPFCIRTMFKYMYTVMHSYKMVCAEAMKQSQQRLTSIPCMPTSYLSYCTVYSTRIRMYVCMCNCGLLCGMCMAVGKTGYRPNNWTWLDWICAMTQLGHYTIRRNISFGKPSFVWSLQWQTNMRNINNTSSLNYKLILNFLPWNFSSNFCL